MWRQGLQAVSAQVHLAGRAGARLFGRTAFALHLLKVTVCPQAERRVRVLGDALECWQGLGLHEVERKHGQGCLASSDGVGAAGNAFEFRDCRGSGRPKHAEAVRGCGPSEVAQFGAGPREGVIWPEKVREARKHPAHGFFSGRRWVWVVGYPAQEVWNGVGTDMTDGLGGTWWWRRLLGEWVELELQPFGQGIASVGRFSRDGGVNDHSNGCDEDGSGEAPFTPSGHGLRMEVCRD
jgi:hypothetical protein